MEEAREAEAASDLLPIEIEVGGDHYDALVDKKGKELLESGDKFPPGRPFLFHVEPGICPALEEEGATLKAAGRELQVTLVRTRTGQKHTEVFVQV